MNGATTFENYSGAQKSNLSDVPRAGKDLNEERGKVLEAIVFGEGDFSPANEDISRSVGKMNKLIMESVGGDDRFQKFADLWAHNPNTLKLSTSELIDSVESLGKRLASVRDRERRGTRFAKGEDSVSIARELSEKQSRLNVLNKIKDTVKEKGGFIIGQMCNIMSKIQEAEPLQKDFSTKLIFALRNIFNTKGIEVNKLQFVTTLVKDPNAMTWPDFFGVDAFVEYDLIINGVKKKGRILIDGTNNRDKADKMTGYGVDGFAQDKLRLPFSSLKTKDDLGRLGIGLAQYIADEVVPRM